MYNIQPTDPNKSIKKPPVRNWAKRYCIAFFLVGESFCGIAGYLWDQQHVLRMPTYHMAVFLARTLLWQISYCWGIVAGYLFAGRVNLTNKSTEMFASVTSHSSLEDRGASCDALGYVWPIILQYIVHIGNISSQMKQICSYFQTAVLMHAFVDVDVDLVDDDDDHDDAKLHQPGLPSSKPKVYYSTVCYNVAWHANKAPKPHYQRRLAPPSLCGLYPNFLAPGNSYRFTGQQPPQLSSKEIMRESC